MNFLVLTPDGVGSTYLQRALTVYLNASGAVYYNTHELLNGLMLDHYGNLHKRMKGYSQPLSEICELLEINKAKIISRLALYHIDGRLAGRNPIPPKGIEINPKWCGREILERNKKEDYKFFYDVCNHTFGKKIYCTRDPFEYALSWGIRTNEANHTTHNQSKIW